MTPLATGPSGTEQENADDRTLLTVRLIAAPPDQVYAVRRFAVPANEEDLDRLEVETMNPRVETPSS